MLEEAKAEIDGLKNQISEKDVKYRKLLQEKTNLEDSLLKDAKPAGGFLIGHKKDDDLKRWNSNNDYKAQIQQPTQESSPIKESKAQKTSNEEVSALVSCIEELKKQIA